MHSGIFPPPVQFIKHGLNEPYGGKDLPVHKVGAFAFPDINIKEPPMDGWAALKILNTPGHPQREMVQQRCNLTTRTVGEKFLRLMAANQCTASVDEAYASIEYGGGQYINPDGDDELEWLEDYEFGTNNIGRGSLPDQQEIDDAYEEACTEIEMLKLCKYKVSYHHPLTGWQQRWPRIGDLVDIPIDLQTDLETEEPLEARPSAANHLYDDRWFDNHRPNTLTVGSNARARGRGSFSPDPIPEKITLKEFLEQPCLAGKENAETFAIIADRKERHMLEVAVWKLAEFGELLVTEGVQRRYGLRPKYIKGVGLKFTAAQLAEFLVWAAHKRFRQRWEYPWILNGIYCYAVESEAWTRNKLTHRKVLNDDELYEIFKSHRLVS